MSNFNVEKTTFLRILNFYNSSEYQHAKAVNIINSGQEFIAALDELRLILQKTTYDEVNYANLIAYATKAVKTTTHQNLVILSTQISELKEVLATEEIKRDLHAGKDLIINSVFATAGFFVAGYGVSLLNGFFLLALGPWGVAAIGVGLLLVGLAIGYMALLPTQRNARYYLGRQIAELENFITALEEFKALEFAEPPTCFYYQ